MEQTENKRSFFSVKNIVIMVLIIAVIALLLGFWLYERSKYVWTNDAQIEGYYVDIAPDVEARIITMNVDEGDYVTQGQIISQLDDTILLSKQKRAQANIKAAEDNVKVKKAYFEKIRNDYIRAEKGISDQIISEQEYDHREKTFLMAQAEYDQSESELLLAQKELGVIDEMLRHTVVYAPRNGYIAKRWILQGDVMRFGQTMFSLYDLDHIWVLARLEETKVENVRIGSPVEISIDAYPGYTFHGQVYVIKTAAASQFTLIPQDNATGNYTKVAQRVPMKISIKKPKNFPNTKPLYLFPGMSAEVKIRVKK